MASDYKEYRSKERINARVITSDVRVIVKGDDGQFSEVDLKAGDFEIRADDGSLSYKTKAQFESANELVRRERQAKATGKGKGSGSKNKQDKDKAAPANVST